ncbi:MAG: hypothetical protein QXN42_01405 [Ignisphaera sp.]
MKSRMNKGISELLAIVLGIVITIAIGMALFTLAPGYFNSLQQQQRIAITSFNINSVDNKVAVATVNIKNLGTKDISNVTIYISSSKNASFTLLPINRIGNEICYNNINVVACPVSVAPGQEISLALQLRSTSSSIVIGDKVIVTVVATFVDKSVSTSSATGYIY